MRAPCCSTAQLLNCSAGKDRTGIGTVLLLMALGVPRTTIRHDFLLSGRYFPTATEVDRLLLKYAVPGKDPALLHALLLPLLETPVAYLDTVFAAIDDIRDRYGSTDEAFLGGHYGLDPAQLAALRDRYTI